MTTQLTVGVISNVFDGPFHTPLIHAIHEALHARGHRMVFFQGAPGAIHESGIGRAVVDAWLAVSAVAGAARLAEQGKPLLLVSGAEGGLPSVLPDNRAGAWEVMRHLLDAGHRAVAFVGYLENPDFRERLEVYREALAERGLAPDPALVIDPGGYDILLCHHAVARALEGGARPTAVFGANDWAAMGAVQALRERGLRVPEDVAIAGFDDMPAAEVFDPPLTSVRQRPDVLGRTAVDLLLRELAGGGRPPAVTRVATSIVVRDSSRAAPAGASASLDGRYRGDGWRGVLAGDLVAMALDPVSPEPGRPPESYWPSLDGLLGRLDLAAQGARVDPPPPAVWAEGSALAGGYGRLVALIDRLRAAGYQRMARPDQASAEALADFLSVCQQRISTDATRQLTEQFEHQRLTAIAESDLLIHLSRHENSAARLDWVETTWIDWAALGLLSRAGGLELTSLYERGRGASRSGRRVTAESFPPLDLLPEALAASPAHALKVTPLETREDRWGYIATCERYLTAPYDMLASRSGFIALMLERDHLLGSLTDRQQVLQQAYDRERALADTIRELGCPLIPLLEGVLLVPLVGAIDDQRAQQVVERVLAGVSEARATHVLLDITGVPLVDTHVAAALVRTAQAVKLLGARVTMVGVRPEIAQSIVSLHIDLGVMETRPTLAAALRELQRGGRAPA